MATVREFEEAMEEIKAFDAAAHDWLKAIPHSSWAKAHFSGRAHCDILLNNICESFNSKIVDGRDQPIITCLEYIREYLMKRIVLIQKVQDKSHGTLTPTATLIFENIKRAAGDYIVTLNGGDMYQCNGPWDEHIVVNMRIRQCACMRWELSGIPCKHAVASLWNMSLNGKDIGLIEDWVHLCYRLDTWKEAYAFKIQPTNGITMWPKSDCPTRLLPPLHHAPIGRPRKKRSRGANEPPLVSGGKLSRFGKSVRCGKCGNRGHNFVICKGQGGPSTQPIRKTVGRGNGRGASGIGRGTHGNGRGAVGKNVRVGGQCRGGGSSQQSTSQMGHGSQTGRGRGAGQGRGGGQVRGGGKGRGNKAFGGNMQ